MATDPSQLRVHLTGGSSNTNPNLSLGGFGSNTRVEGQLITELPEYVTPLQASGLAGTGNTIEWDGTNLRLSRNGGDLGPPVPVSESGDYFLQGGTYPDIDCSMLVNIQYSLLPGSASWFFDAANNNDALFNSLSVPQAAPGITQYRCVWVRSINGIDSFGRIQPFMKSEASGVDYSFAIDPDVPPQTIANELTAPVGITWSNASAPSSDTEISSLAPAEGFGLWIRRTVAAGTPVAGSDRSGMLAFAVYQS